LTVLAAYQVAKDGVAVRFGKGRDNDGPNYGGGVRLEIHEEIQREIIESTPDGFGIGDNRAAVEREADFYLDSINAEYQVRPTAQIEVPLIHHFEPDGALRQIAWAFGAQGPAPTTVLAYNTELSSFEPDYRDTPAQRAQRVADAAARQRAALIAGQVK
jgi:hypothetical protein